MYLSFVNEEWQNPKVPIYVQPYTWSDMNTNTPFLYTCTIHIYLCECSCVKHNQSESVLYICVPGNMTISVSDRVIDEE